MTKLRLPAISLTCILKINQTEKLQLNILIDSGVFLLVGLRPKQIG